MTERSRLFLAVAALGLLGAGCQRVSGALAVKLHADPALIADCLKVTVLDGSTPVRWAVLPRVAGQADYLVAVVQTQDMPASVTLQASGWLGTCADEATLRLNGRGATVAATFPETQVQEVPLAVGPPGGDLDADGDGYVAAALGGADCDDTNPAIHPGAPQDCGSLVDANCDGKVACADPTCTAAAACASPPDRITLSGLAQAGTVGQCLGPVAVGLGTSAGPRAATASTAVTLAASAGLTLFGGSGCTGGTPAQVTIPFLGTSVQVWVRLDAPGPATLSASSPLLLPAVAQVVVQPTAITALSLSGVPAALRANECSAPLTVAVQGAGGATTVPAGSTLTITLGAQPQDPTGNFFSTPDCSLPAVAQVSIPGGQGSATFRVRATRTPTLALTASATGGLSAQASVPISAGPAAQVAFLNAPLGLRSSDSCSTVRNALLQLETRDGFGNPAPAGSTVKLGLSSSGPPLTFFLADAGVPPCATQLTEVAIPQGASRADVALRVTGTGPGTVTATPNLAGFASPSQAYTAAAGDPVKVVFTSLAQTLQAGQCTPGDVILEARDSASNPSSFLGAIAVQLTRSGGAADPRFAFYGQAGCAAASALDGGVLAFPAGQSQAHFFFRGEKTATFNVVAAPTSGGILGDTSAGNQVRAGPPAALVWAPPATASAVAGACAPPLTLQVQDGYANLTSFAAATPLTVTSVPPGTAFGLAAGACQGTQPFTLDAGVQSLPVAGRATAAAAYAVSASAGGAATAAAATLTVTPGSAILTVTPAGTVAVTAGACTQLGYALADALGNPVPAGPGGDTLALGALPGGVTAYPTAADCGALTNAATGFPVPQGASTRSVWVRATAASATAVTVTATLGGASAPVGLLVSADVAAALAFQGLPASQPSGACSGALAVRRLDRFGNPAVSGPASAGVSGGALAYTASADCSGAGGPSAGVTFPGGASVSSAFSVTGAAAGATTVTADAGTLSASATFTVTPGPPAAVRFTSAPGGVLAGACSGPLALQVRDSAGNPTPATGLGVSLASSPDPVAFFGDGACGTALDGGFSLTGTAATLSFRARTAPALETLTAATTAPASSDFQVWTVSLGPPAAVAWTAPPPATLARATCSNAAQVQLQDLGGNPVPPAGATSVTFSSSSPDAGLAFYQDALCATPAAAAAVDGTGAAGVYLGAVGSGATVVAAGSAGLASTPGQVLTVVGDPGVLTAAAPEADLEAGGCMALTITRDAGVQPSLGVTPLRFSVSDAGLTVHADATCAAPALTAAAIPEGAVGTTVWLRGRSVPAPLSTLDVTVSDATSGCLPAVRTLRTYPLVRRGSCDIPAGQATSTCSLGLPFDDLSRTFLVFQSTANSPGATNNNNALVECHLVLPGASVTCARQNVSGEPAAQVQWQTVSWGRGADDGGLTVEHLAGSLDTAQALQSLARGPADLARSFLLFSVDSFSNNNSRVEDFATARLTTDGGVLVARTVITTPLPTADYALQVVQLGGARVDRGTSDGGAVAALGAACGLSAPATPRLSALFSTRVSASGTQTAACEYAFRGAVTGAVLAVHRGGATPPGGCVGSTVPELAWEFVEWPAGTVVERPGSAADAGTVDLASGALTGTWVPSQGVSLHRTLLYSPGQGPNGQAWGETDRTGDPASGAGAALLTPDGGAVTLTRGMSGNAARFTPVAVTFDP